MRQKQNFNKVKFTKEKKMVMEITYVIVSFIISSVLVNAASGLFMKVIGAKAMMFNGKKRFVTILVVTWFIFNMIHGA
ncbi:MAG: hypothetical protein VB018_05635 [Lachnospiraceae bacterium]|nr:hypothetical protein [Lachnospiraceae bacterium]